MHLFLGEHASRPLLVELQQEQQFLKVSPLVVGQQTVWRSIWVPF